MKKWNLLIVLILPFLVLAQEKEHTANLEYINENTVEDLKLEDMSKEELFMRGLSREGSTVTNKVAERRAANHYKKGFDFGKEQGAKIHFHQLSFEGKYGDSIAYQFSLQNKKERTTLWNIISESSNIRVDKSEILTLPEEKVTINLQIVFPKDNQNAKLIFENELNEKVEVWIILDGYDLGEADFKTAESSATPEEIFHIKNRSTINIKLDGTEKLLRIIRNGRIISHQTVSQLISQVDVTQFETGIYTFEIVDMKTNQARRCQVKMINSAF